MAPTVLNVALHHNQVIQLQHLVQIVNMKETCEILRKVGTDEKAPNALLMDPVDMAIAIRNHCKSRTGGCEGCCFDRPTSDNGDGECVLGCPEDWEV